MHIRTILAFALYAVLLAVPPAARALDPAITLDGYHHERWGELEGAPRFIDTLAQTDDGWLWVGSRYAGLFRFDGMRFHPFETVDGSKLQLPGITALRPARDGALWIGHGHGGVTVLRDGRYRHLLTPAQTGAIYAITLDKDGVAWVASMRGLYRIVGDHSERIGTERGYPAAVAEHVLADGAGRLWVTDGLSVYLLEAGAAKFERVRDARADPMLIEAGDGSIWLVLGKTFERVAPPAVRRVAALPGRSNSFQSAFDRDGNLWSGNCPVGVCVLRAARRDAERFTPVGAAERFDQPWQMTSLSVLALMEDRDGSIWIGTPAGLERLRDHAVHMVPELFDQGKSLAAPAPDGSLYNVEVRKFDETTSLWGITGDRVVKLPDPLAAQALSRAPDGTLVLAGPRGVALLGPSGVRRVDLPADLSGTRRLNIVSVYAGLGEFWMRLARSGTWHYRDGRWTPPTAPREDRPTVIAIDAAGRSYHGLPGKRLRVVDGAAVREYGAADGLAVSGIRYIHPADPLLVSGEGGTQVLAGGRFHTLRFDVPGGIAMVSGLAGGPNGQRWLNTERGILRVQPADWARTIDDPRVAIRGRLFDALDGYVGGGETTALTNTAVAGPDGKLWFAGERGLAWVEPGKLAANPALPDVEILAVTAGGRRLRPGPPMRLDQGTGDVQVDYTVPALRMPQRVTFRYRLAGDAAWQDAGTRRTAYFQRLPPGEHAFDVMAIDEEGAASRVTTLRFSIAPTMAQTWWFRGAAACAVLLAMVLAYRLRTRRLAARIEERLLLRVSERESIARSLHDTFLQSVQGVLLSMHSAMVKLPAGSTERAELERVLQRAESVLAEGRDEVKGLRGEFGSAADFWQALLRDVELTVPGGTARVRLVKCEAVARLQPKLYRDVHAIAREALTNALRHTAGQVTLAASATARTFELVIGDEGAGLGRFTDGKPGHFGLPGMRERAAQLGGRLQIDSTMHGTRVTLVIPANRAYARGVNGSGATAPA